MLADEGIARLTVEGVARRTGVGKPTIYRYWANAHDLAMAAILERSVAVEPTVGSSPLDTLRVQLVQLVRSFDEPVGRQAAILMATADHGSRIARAFRSRIMLGTRERAEALLTQARDEGALRPDARIETALDMIFGPIFYRLLFESGELSVAYAEDLLDTVLRGTLAPDRQRAS